MGFHLILSKRNLFFLLAVHAVLGHHKLQVDKAFRDINLSAAAQWTGQNSVPAL